MDVYFFHIIRRKFKGKIVTNIDGLEWKRDKWNPLAKWLLHTSEKLAVNILGSRLVSFQYFSQFPDQIVIAVVVPPLALHQVYHGSVG